MTSGFKRHSTRRRFACRDAPSRRRHPAGPDVRVAMSSQPSTQTGLVMSVGTLQTGLKVALAGKCRKFLLKSEKDLLLVLNVIETPQLAIDSIRFRTLTFFPLLPSL